MKNHWFKISFLSLALFSLFIFSFSIVSAANLNDSFKTTDGSNLNSVTNRAGFNTAVDATSTSGNLQILIGKIISTVLGILGVIFVILIIYGGILWMTGGDNEDQITQATTIIRNSVIGLIIVVAAYAISYFIINVLVNSTLNPSGATSTPAGEMTGDGSIQST